MHSYNITRQKHLRNIYISSQEKLSTGQKCLAYIRIKIWEILDPKFESTIFLYFRKEIIIIPPKRI